MDAKVTVGIPVYNGGGTLRRAVESVLAQTYRNFLIHISDNASTDSTAEIGQMLALAHPEITFTRHPTGLGAAGNFRFLLQAADTEFFMWLAADDYIKPAYVDRTITALATDPTLVACASRAHFIQLDGATKEAWGTHPLMADPVSNLSVYLSNPGDNTRLYALYRTAPLQISYPRSQFHALDWAVAAGTLRFGKHGQINEVLMVRDKTPTSSYTKSVRNDGGTWLTRSFPMLRMTADLIFRQRIPLRWSILKALLSINLDHHFNYMAMFHPGYMKVTKPLWNFWTRHISWRLKTQ